MSTRSDDTGSTSTSTSTSEWKSRVLQKVSGGALVGSLGGALLASTRQLSVPRIAFNMGMNFAIFAGCSGTLQELIRLTTDNSTWLNSLASGALAGGFLCGVNRGPRSILPGALFFGTALGLVHSLYDHFKFYDMYRATLVSFDLLEMNSIERKHLEESQAWDVGKYWPSSIPSPIRIHSEDEVERLAALRRKALHEKMNPKNKE